MAAGDLLILEHLGVTPCHTPACGYREAYKEGSNGPADIVRIGRYIKIVCQRCAGCWPINEQMEKR